jgi:hypothetical protein
MVAPSGWRTGQYSERFAFFSFIAGASKPFRTCQAGRAVGTFELSEPVDKPTLNVANRGPISTRKFEKRDGARGLVA